MAVAFCDAPATPPDGHTAAITNLVRLTKLV